MAVQEQTPYYRLREPALVDDTGKKACFTYLPKMRSGSEIFWVHHAKLMTGIHTYIDLLLGEPIGGFNTYLKEKTNMNVTVA